MTSRNESGGAVNAEWPPIDEPITSMAVVARLDHLGWCADCTTLLDHTARHALARYSDKTNPPMWPVIDLRDGHRVASYGTPESARTAFEALARGGEPDE